MLIEFTDIIVQLLTCLCKQIDTLTELSSCLFPEVRTIIFYLINLV